MNCIKENTNFEPYTTNELVLPLEVHVFQHGTSYYVFDVRNFSIFKVTELGAAVIKRVHRMPLQAILAELSTTWDSLSIRQQYLKYLQMLENKILSSEPLPPPGHQLFQRLVLMLASGCNMGCTYCFEKETPLCRNVNLMNQEQADRILDWFYRHHEGKTAHIQLYGGEPLLNWEILKYIVKQMDNWADVNKVHLTKYMITNGTLLNPRRVKWLKTHEVTVQVSVDGLHEIHDYFRVFKSGQPTLDCILPSILQLKEQGVNYNLRAVLTRREKNPTNIIKYLHSLGARKASFEVVSTNNPEAKFTRQDWKDYLIAYHKHVYTPATCWNELPRDLQTVIRRICEYSPVFYGCSAGKSEVTITNNGDIYECQRLFRGPCGNIAQDPDLDNLNRSFLSSVDTRAKCRNCWARYLCGGGCLHQTYTDTGSEIPLDEFCSMKQTLAEAAIVKIDEFITSHRSIPAGETEKAGE